VIAIQLRYGYRPAAMEVAFAILVGAAGAGGIAFARVLRRNQALRWAGFAFAAGTLLSVILMHVMPEALRATPHAAALFVAGFLLMMLAHQHGMRADPCCGHDEHTRYAGGPSFLALCLCGVNDGLVLSADLHRGLASPLLWAMCVHKATAAFALLMLLRDLGALRSRRQSALYLAGFVAVTPASLLLAAQLHSATPLWAPLLAVSAGALLYVIAGSLVPRVEHLAREGLGPVLLVFAAAVLVNVGVQVAAPHEHAAHAADNHDLERPGREAPERGAAGGEGADSPAAESRLAPADDAADGPAPRPRHLQVAPVPHK
jgi:zinc transporter ZupT